MLAHWYTLLLQRAQQIIVGRREVIRLSCPITLAVQLDGAITRTVALSAAIDLEDV